MGGEFTLYRENFFILGDDKRDIVGKRILAGSSGIGHQVIVVDKIIASQSNQNQSLIY